MGSAQPPADLPRRLWVIGTCGSGKSTLAVRLGEVLGIPALDMDELHWRPGWVSLPDDQLHAAVDEATSGPAWVMAGNYDRFRARVDERVDLVVWLDLPFHVTFARLVRRTADRAGNGTPCCNGNRETWRKALTTRDSILWWGLKTFRRRRRNARQELAHRPHVRLRTARQVEAWVAALARHAQADRPESPRALASSAR